MNVLVFELDHEGHRLTYVRLLIQSLLDLQCQVTFATGSDQLESEESKVQIDPIRSQIEILPMDPVSSGKPMDIAKQRVSRIDSLLKQQKYDYVFIPSADGVAQVAGTRSLVGALSRWRQTPIEIVMHHGGFAYPTQSKKRKLIDWFTRQALRRGPWHHVHFVDLIVSEWVAANDAKLESKSSLVPDPIEKAERLGLSEARAVLDLPRQGRIVGCAGAMNRRKKVDLLLESFAAANLNDDDRLLLAGRADDDIRQLIEIRYRDLVQQKRIIVLDKFLSFEHMHAALSAMDVVALLYGGHQAISSILLRSVAAGRPVLARRGGWIERMTSTFDLGVVSPSESVEDIKRTLKQALDFSNDYVPGAATDRVLEFHDERNFGAVLTAGVAKRLGRSQTFKSFTWDMVVRPGSSSS